MTAPSQKTPDGVLSSEAVPKAGDGRDTLPDPKEEPPRSGARTAPDDTCPGSPPFEDDTDVKVDVDVVVDRDDAEQDEDEAPTVLRVAAVPPPEPSWSDTTTLPRNDKPPERPISELEVVPVPLPGDDDAATVAISKSDLPGSDREPEEPDEPAAPKMVLPGAAELPPWSLRVASNPGSVPPVSLSDSARPAPRGASPAGVWLTMAVALAAGVALAGFALVVPRALAASFASGGYGAVMVTVTSPAGAPVQDVKVYVDSELRCLAAPCRVGNVVEGAHAVSVVAPGFTQLAARGVAVNAGDDAAINFRLLERRAKVD